MAPILSTLILNYRTPLQAVKCVQALKKQTIADEMEILVIDNHSDDDSIGILRARLAGVPGVRVVEAARNVGFGAGYNLGIKLARGEFILINNPAKILAPDGAAIMLEAMRRDPSIGIVGPLLQHDDGTIRDSYRAFPRMGDVVIKRTFLRSLFPERLKHYLQAGTDPHRRRDVDWLIGGCLMLRREVAQNLHGFDDRYFLFFEDIDLCRRCWELGKRVVYLPEAKATDRKRRLSEGGAWSLIRTPVGRAHIRSAMRYFAKWHGKALPQHA
jgi:N-acetylglucosaminyl-diphospho-decaprenol L-rhamnosyltransferase